MTGSPSIDRQIERVNKAIGQLWQEAFPNDTFWQWRYLTDPELGSGIGSRGQPLLGKRELLATLLEAIAPTSVIDVGCGDGEATRDLPMPGYVGIDVSSEAVRRAKIGRSRRHVPRWQPCRLSRPSRSHHLSRRARSISPTSWPTGIWWLGCGSRPIERW